MNVAALEKWITAAMSLYIQTINSPKYHKKLSVSAMVSSRLTKFVDKIATDKTQTMQTI